MPIVLLHRTAFVNTGGGVGKVSTVSTVGVVLIERREMCAHHYCFFITRSASRTVTMEGSNLYDNVPSFATEDEELADEEVLADDETIINNQLEPTNNDVLRCFILTYESYPQLWSPSHPDYLNKSKRNSAIDELLKIYSRLKPGATRADVRRKLNTLRSNYRKELRKIALSQTTVAEGQEPYKPTSWVFYALTFLNGCVHPQFDQPSLEESRDSFLSETDNSTAKDYNGIESAIASMATVTSSSPAPPTPVKKRRATGLLTKQTELLPSAAVNKRIEAEDNAVIPTVAKVWGEKLRELDPKQRLFAEKAINDILFEASLGNLSRNSVKINDDRQS